MSAFAMTSYLQKAVGDHLLGKSSLAMPAELYLSLHSADPTDSGSFANELSASGTGYARIPILTSMSAVNLGTGISQNTLTLQFPTPLADWVTATHVGISDASPVGTGNMWFRGQLSTARAALLGDPIQFVPGTAQLQFD